MILLYLALMMGQQPQPAQPGYKMIGKLYVIGANIQCYWVEPSGSAEIPGKDYLLDWSIIERPPDSYEQFVVVKNYHGLVEMCTVTIPHEPIKCYGQTASYCDETYPEKEKP